jgi:DNA-directed RNA polymerase specialized sigma24 family protein
LSFVEREALLLKSRDGLTYAEIGAVLGTTPEAAEARVAAALVSLRARLERKRRFPWLFR